jgi:AAA domain-containing protein
MDDTTTLYHELADRLSTSGTTGSVTALVLAAFRGDDDLTAVMRGEPLPAAPADPAVADEETPIFLESVRVTGFRGIGTQAALRLKPEPGLTVVAGRNGSAKSSFAEATEYVLTEDSPRWSQRPAVFRDGWRNLHHDGDREIAVTLRRGSGGPPIVYRRSWAAGETDVSAATVTVTRGGAAIPAGDLPDRVGARFRPFLSARAVRLDRPDPGPGPAVRRRRAPSGPAQGTRRSGRGAAFGIQRSAYATRRLGRPACRGGRTAARSSGREGGPGPAR